MFRLIRSSASSPQKAAGSGQLRGFEPMSAKKDDEDRRMAKALPQVSDDPRVFARIGYLVIIVTFGVIGGWAGLVPFAGAGVARGAGGGPGDKETRQHPS